jgi:hypothetical protein
MLGGFGQFHLEKQIIHVSDDARHCRDSPGFTSILSSALP